METKTLMLGTAQWGWTVSREEAFHLMDAWLAAGFRHIDAATNYPINKNPADFRASEHILLEYIRTHGIRDLKINMKIGALDNLRTPDINSSPSFILMMSEEYKRVFGENLHGIMLHWDNRSDVVEVHRSLEALATVQQTLNVRPGLSGIKYPEVYAAANRELGLTFDVEGKHNILHTDLPRYAPLFSADSGGSTPLHRFFGYGINAGGLKLEGPYPAGSTYLARGGNPENVVVTLEQIRKKIPDWNLAFVRPPVRTMNHLGLIFAGLHPAVHGIVLGLRSVAQLKETLDFWRNLETYDYSDIWKALNKLEK
jgi:aryl-alcohol dehydrogenase-like predicted oxidoreductase